MPKKKAQKGLTLEQYYAWLRTLEVGTVIETGVEKEMPYVILRGHYSLCAYIGVPEEDAISSIPQEQLQVDVHGGVTFSGPNPGLGEPIPRVWWFGWDYAHAGDRVLLPPELDEDIEERQTPYFEMDLYNQHCHLWTVEEVRKEVQRIAKELQYLRAQLEEG